MINPLPSQMLDAFIRYYFSYYYSVDKAAVIRIKFNDDKGKIDGWTADRVGRRWDCMRLI